MRYFAPLFCLIALAGCSSNLSAIRDLKPAADDFSGALAAEYRDFATSENEQGRSGVAEHFAGKGLLAYQGADVAPDALSHDVDAPSQAELSEARGQLMGLLNNGVKKAAPQELARAQLLFDCWQQQVVSRIAAEKALCKPEFAPTLNQVLERAGPSVYDEAFRHSIVFEPGTSSLTAEHMTDIDDVVTRLSGHREYWVELRAYVGKKISQRKLTEARILSVKRALLKKGVSAHQVRIKREGGKGVMLSRDNIPTNTKVVTITIVTDQRGRKWK